MAVADGALKRPLYRSFSSLSLMRIFSSMILSSLAIDGSREGSSSSTFAKSARASLSFQTAAWALARLYKAFTLSVAQNEVSSNGTRILVIGILDEPKPK